MGKWKASIAASLSVLGSLPMSSVLAQIDEIVVTAQRREQNLQDVPLSVTAIGFQQIEDSRVIGSLGIDNIVPNLEIKTFGGVPSVTIRGVGNNDFNSSSVGPVAIYRDDVVLASAGSQIFSLFDLERIEVLRGPQGTLFGKNTTGGAIVFVSKLPGEEADGYARLGVGRFDLMEAEAGVTIPLSDDLSARVSGVIRRRDGERVNLFDGERLIDLNEGAMRVLVRYLPSESEVNADLRVAFGFGRDRSDYHVAKPNGFNNGVNPVFGYSDPAPNDPRIHNQDGDSRNYADNAWASITYSQDLGERFGVKSITGFDSSDVDNRVDVDGSPLRIDDIDLFTETSQFTQELHLSYAGESWDGLFGLYYFYEDFDNRSEADLIGVAGTIANGALPILTEATRENTNMAAFGQATIELSEALRLTLGGRYTADKVEATHEAALVDYLFDPAIPNGDPITLLPREDFSETFRDYSYRLALDYQLADDVLAYASVNRGFKSGTFGIGIVLTPDERSQVEPEYLMAYEIGLKSMWLDNRLRANVSLFYNDYEDLQVLTVRQRGSEGVPTLGLENAADAQIYGMEAEFSYVPGGGLELGLNFSLLDAEFKDFISGENDLSGNVLPNAPDASLSTFAQYTYAFNSRFDGFGRIEYNYTGEQFYNNEENDLVSSRGSYDLINIRASIIDKKSGWTLSGWVRNLTDEEYIVDSTDLRDFGFIPLYYGERQTWGLDVRYDF